MANFIGNPLANLIRDIAYAKGDILAIDIAAPKVWNKLKPLAQEYRRLRAERRSRLAQLTELEARLVASAPLSADDIREIQRTPKKIGAPYGAVVTELVRLVEGAEGPIGTNAVIASLAEKFNLPMATGKQRAETRSLVRHKLRTLAKKGVVKRLRDPTKERNAEGLWLWIGL
jgi:hypothetical protein